MTLVAQEDIPPWRRKIGWHVPEFGGAQVLVRPDRTMIAELMTQAGSGSVHVFSGVRAYPMVQKAFLRSLNTDAHIGVMAEAGKWRGARGVLRRVRGRMDARRYRDRIGFVLAIGHLARHWFQMSGYSAAKIYPYAYFVEGPSELSTACSQPLGSATATFDLAFIGQCIHRKGIDLLMKALAGLRHANWRLRIIGDGAQREDLEALSARLGIAHQVRFEGAQDNPQAMSILAVSDLLVLPSRWDGWGAVVNEALMRGVPVICSDRCGATDLLVRAELGTVFKAGSVESLRAALRRWLALGKNTSHRARIVQAWSACIYGRAAADYLVDVIAASAHQAARPIPPWAAIPQTNEA